MLIYFGSIWLLAAALLLDVNTKGPAGIRPLNDKPLKIVGNVAAIALLGTIIAGFFVMPWWWPLAGLASALICAHLFVYIGHSAGAFVIVAFIYLIAGISMAIYSLAA